MWSVPESTFALTSMPAMPARSAARQAARKSAAPKALSWSVSARARTCAAFAKATRASGVSLPSE